MSSDIVNTPESSAVDITAPADRVHVRIFHYNDCYEIVHLPALKAAMDALALDESVPGNKNIRLIAGDFLAPSVLSSVDEGECMVDCMNQLKLDFCTIGNHEQDVTYEAFVERVKESEFTWVNSNIINFPEGTPAMPDRFTVKVDNGSGHDRTITFIGTLCNDPAMYKPGAFWGAKILPTFDTIMKMYDEIMGGETPQADLFQAVTHQYMPPDRILAKLCKGKLAVILGGHDHGQHTETHEHVKAEIDEAAAKNPVSVSSTGVIRTAPLFPQTTIIKATMDGLQITVTDYVWESRTDPIPDVSVQTVSVKNFTPDAILQERVQAHSKRLLGQLEAAKIMRMPRNLGVLTSKDIRVAQRTMGTFITSNIRDGFTADCFAMASGSIRRGHDYEESHEVFTYRDLISECPFYDNCRVVNMPGKVFSDMVSFSRSSHKYGTGGFMQLCDRITYVEGQGVTHIAGEPLVAEKIYRIVSTCAALDGVDSNLPLIDWLQSGTSNLQELPSEGHPDLILQKQALLRFAARNVVVHYLEKHPIGDSATVEIPLAKFKDMYPDQPDWFLQNVWQHLDWDNDGKLGVMDIAVILCTVWLAREKKVCVEDLRARLITIMGSKNAEFVMNDIVEGQNPEDAGTVSRNAIGQWYLRVLARLTTSA